MKQHKQYTFNQNITEIFEINSSKIIKYQGTTKKITPGSPVYDTKGYSIGITIRTDENGISYAIHWDTVKKFILTANGLNAKINKLNDHLFVAKNVELDGIETQRVDLRKRLRERLREIEGDSQIDIMTCKSL